MTEERNTAAPETEESRNFILNLIDQDIAEGGQFRDRPSTPGFRRAQRLSASDTVRPCASTSAPPRSSAVSATSAWMTPTR